MPIAPSRSNTRTIGVSCDTKLWIASVRLTWGVRLTRPSSTRSMMAMVISIRGWREEDLRSFSIHDLAKPIRRCDQLARDAGLPRGMSRVGDDHVARFRPRKVKLVGREDRAHCVVAPLHDGARKMTVAVDAREQRIVGQEDIVHDIF